MGEWKKVLVSGSDIEVRQITASGLSEASQSHIVVYDTQSGALHYTSSDGLGGGGGIFVDQGDYYNTANTLQITGSILQTSPSQSGTGTSSFSGGGSGNQIYSVLLSESLYSYNHNVGYPKSNGWKDNLEGSYFNNFDANTNTSEILRFIAGLLSASAPDASPNTEYYQNISEVVDTNHDDIGTSPPGRVPQSALNPIVAYIRDKGFASSGTVLFNGISTIYTDSEYNIKYSSAAGGDTIVSSSVGTFNLGSLGDTFYVSASQSWLFSSQSDKTPTATTSQESLLSQAGPGSSNGLYVGEVPTVNPLIIPPAYQDGKFVSILQADLYNGGISFANITESIGYYQITSSIAIASGSSEYSSFKTRSKEIFYADTTALNNNIPTNTINHIFASSSLTAISNSLSGAPYLVSATYNIQVTSSGVFDPLYHEGTVIWSVIGNDNKITLNDTDQDMLNGAISGDSFVYISTTSTTPRSAGQIPARTDVLKTSRTLTFNAGNSDNIIQNGFSSDLGFGITASAYNRNSNQVLENTSFNFFNAGTFGQPLASGTMAYHNPTATNSSNTKNEYFEDEVRRVQLNGSSIDSTTNLDLGNTSNIYNSGSNLAQNNPRALQVKPGFLITPGGTYKYWHQASGYYDASGYYWYIREFDSGLSGVNTLNSFTIQFNNISTTNIQNWDSATNGISLGIIFESDPDKLIDINQSDDNIGIGITSTNTQLNPFSNSIDIRGNTGRTISGTSNPTYTVKVNAAQGLFLDSTYTKFWLVIRYKGDPTPITLITTNL